MFLSDVDIKKGIKTGQIVIRPYSDKQLQVASYDVTLGNEFEVTDRHITQVVDPCNKIYPKTRTVKVKDGEPFILHPGESVLGKQREFIGVDNEQLILARLTSKTSQSYEKIGRYDKKNSAHFVPKRSVMKKTKSVKKKK